MRPEHSRPTRSSLPVWARRPRVRRLAFVLALAPGAVSAGLLAPALRAPGLLLGGLVWIASVWIARGRIERALAARTSPLIAQEPET